MAARLHQARSSGAARPSLAGGTSSLLDLPLQPPINIVTATSVKHIFFIELSLSVGIEIHKQYKDSMLSGCDIDSSRYAAIFFGLLFAFSAVIKGCSSHREIHGEYGF
jgi:hypothetical protein